MSTTLRVFIVDDHPVVCAGLTTVLESSPELTVVGSAPSGERALCDLRSVSADVVLLDHRMGSGMDGVELCRRLTQPPYLTRCMAMSASADGESVRSFISAGASGFLLKHADPSRIIDAVRTVGRGASYMDDRIAALIAEELAPASEARSEGLTPRETEVLELLAAGMSNREIASELGVSTGSAKNYVSSLLQKLGVAHRTEAVAVAAREGLLLLMSGRRPG